MRPGDRSEPADSRRGGRCRLARLLLVVLATSAAGCGSLPTQEMSDARRAITVATEAGADERAPASLAEAQRLLRLAGGALEAGDYDRARTAALAAKASAVGSHRLAQAVERASRAISAATALGTDTGRARALLELARGAETRGDLGTAEALALEAFTEAGAR